MFSFLIFSTLAAFADATNEIPPLSPAYGQLAPTFLEQHKTTIIVAGFAFLAFAFLFLKAMMRPVRPKILPPEAVARQALDNLQSQPEDGNVLSAVSHILRRYVSETFNLSHNELTTSEFCSAIAVNPRIGAEQAATISSFLRECDVRKFSPANLASPIGAVRRASDLVEQIQKGRDSHDSSPTT